MSALLDSALPWVPVEPPIPQPEVRELMPFEAAPYWPQMVAAADETMEVQQ